MGTVHAHYTYLHACTSNQALKQITCSNLEGFTMLLDCVKTYRDVEQTPKTGLIKLVALCVGTFTMDPTEISSHWVLTFP